MPTRVTYAERDQVFSAPTYRYGEGAYGVPPDKLTVVTSPWGIRVRCHKLLVPALEEGWRRARAASTWTPARIDSFAPRDVRGSTSPSLHAYGLACDYFNTATPMTVWGPDNAPDVDFTLAMESVGFYGGYRFTRQADWPHIEWADGQPPANFAPATAASAGTLDIREEDVKATLLTIGPLDSNGNGWTLWSPGLGRAPAGVGVSKHGPYPPDNGYAWPDAGAAGLDLAVQVRGSDVVVTARGGVPGKTYRAFVWAG